MTLPLAEELERLLDVQEHDTALDRLRHRRASLPERAELQAKLAVAAEREREVAGLQERHDALAADERRLDDEAQQIAAKVREADAKLYSGTVTSPRELQAMQADLEQLRRQQRALEDDEIDRMEQRDALSGELDGARGVLAGVEAGIATLRSVIGAAEAEIDAEIAREESARAARLDGVRPELLADYERRRARTKSHGIARLVGLTCQGCRLSIPATEADRMRHAQEAEVYTCDNCGCILVLT